MEKFEKRFRKTNTRHGRGCTHKGNDGLSREHTKQANLMEAPAAVETGRMGELRLRLGSFVAASFPDQRYAIRFLFIKELIKF
jgi:hypothetical protein